MKFGHVSQDDIASVDFALPEMHSASIKMEGAAEIFDVRVGCGKWGIPQWVGPLYPEGTKSKDYLESYIRHFNGIELNGTFYRLSRSSIEKWSEAADGHDFLYCPKWSQRISHFKRLNEVEENVQYFIDSMAMLGDNLGGTFLTLPPNFGAKHEERVHAFIDLIPDNYPVHIEFRHKEWFEEPVFTRTMEKLQSKGLGAVMTDVALRRDVLHMCLCRQDAFVRFNGYALHSSDYSRLDDWIEQLKKWRDRGLKRVYFFMHQANEEHTIVLCDYFIKKLNNELGLSLQPLNLPE